MRTLQNVKHLKRGASHSDGSDWMCIGCTIETHHEGRVRRNRAIYTAEWKSKAGTVLSVGYGECHVPAEVKERVSA